MDNRRQFFKKGLAAGAAVAVPGCSGGQVNAQGGQVFKTTRPQKALVVWYSQTGHTRRYGEVIAKVFDQAGVQAHGCDMRYCGDVNPGEYDLVVAGSPVQYFRAPKNVEAWVQNAGRMDGTAVASFVTFGGPGGNEHNAAYGLLALMTQQGGVPLGMDSFGNMSTYAPTWSMGNEERILKYANLPNEDTYARVEKFAGLLLQSLGQGRVFEPEKEFTLEEWAKDWPVVWGSKMLTTNHGVDQEKCIGCGTCQKVCPVGAIDPDVFAVDTKKCLLCLGCVNNCPEGAVTMNFMGKEVYGFREFLEKNKITILEPEILKS